MNAEQARGQWAGARYTPSTTGDRAIMLALTRQWHALCAETPADDLDDTASREWWTARHLLISRACDHASKRSDPNGHQGEWLAHATLYLVQADSSVGEPLTAVR